MLPTDEDAKRLARQTLTLGEFLATCAEDWEVPQLKRKAVVHFHCHQRATSDIDCDQKVLDRLGLDYEVLESGCCGLAGSFGYERGQRYEVSIKAGERVLLPNVRRASPHTLVVTDGFSCRSQIEHASERGALHIAQVIQMALREGPNGPATPQPEQRYSGAPEPHSNGTQAQAAVAVGTVVALSGAAALARRQRRANGRRGRVAPARRRRRPIAAWR